MSHIALYRKYRPITFEEMVGQEHITDILKKQIQMNKISHAYIFSGTRGTGKTTAAKIFARAINCLNPKDGEPCNECEACRSILSGDSTDVVEMDAASNNSVENIRAIRQEVMYASTQVKYKVYIIDEAHMLSTSAFNALLKTLEEPPESVVFILATTEEHKILPTILSRCIRFEFKKLSEDNIIKRITEVLNDIQITYEEEALKIIAKLSDGALRDALSILERCIDNEHKTLTATRVQDIIGIVEKDLIEDLLVGVLRYDVIEVDKAVTSILNKGKDLRYCLSQLLEILLALMVNMSGDKTEIVSERLQMCMSELGMIRANYILKELAMLDDVLRQTSNPNVIFRAKMIQLATDIKIKDKEDIFDAIKKLEQKIGKQENISVSQELHKENIQLKKQEVKKEEQKELEPLPELPKKVKDFKELASVITKAEEKDSPMLYSALSGIKAYQIGDKINFITDNSFSFSLLKKDELRQELVEVINEVTGKEFEIAIDLKKEEKNSVSDFEQMLKSTGVPFTDID